MPNINDEYKKIVSELDKKIKDEEALQFAKEQFYRLSMVFIEEMQAISDKYEDRMEKLVHNQRDLEERMQKIQDVVNNIEKDIYDEDQDENYDFEIICPYCNKNFVIEIDELREEVQCPECKNTIELDWDGEEEHGCSGGCSHCHQEEDDEEDM